MHDYANHFNMQWKKIDLKAEMWQGKQQCLPAESQKVRERLPALLSKER